MWLTNSGNVASTGIVKVVPVAYTGGISKVMSAGLEF